MKSKSASPEFSVRDFFKRFPDDDACLDHVMSVRFGKEGACLHCGTITTFHRIAKRKAYAGAACGCHIYPCAGTIFEDSRTSLQIWFYAIYLFVATRHGVSGKELQRQLGVTYKTAWRMGQQIRDLMAKADGFQMLAGHVLAAVMHNGGERMSEKITKCRNLFIVGSEAIFRSVLIQKADFGNIDENTKTELIEQLNQTVSKSEIAAIQFLEFGDILSKTPRMTGKLNKAKRSLMSAIDQFTSMADEVRVRIERIKQELAVH